jgi:hypothetical protein
LYIVENTSAPTSVSMPPFMLEFEQIGLGDAEGAAVGVRVAVAPVGEGVSIGEGGCDVADALAVGVSVGLGGEGWFGSPGQYPYS